MVYTARKNFEFGDGGSYCFANITNKTAKVPSLTLDLPDESLSWCFSVDTQPSQVPSCLVRPVSHFQKS